MNWLGPTLAIIAIAAGVAAMFAAKWVKEGKVPIKGKGDWIS